MPADSDRCQFVARSSGLWLAADIAAGTDEATARAAAALPSAAYTGAGEASGS